MHFREKFQCNCSTKTQEDGELQLGVGCMQRGYNLTLPHATIQRGMDNPAIIILLLIAVLKTVVTEQQTMVM